MSARNKSDTENELSNDLNNVSHWLVNNKLSLHLGKTESILFGSKPRIRSQPSLDINCNGSSIESKTSVKYLGVTTDQCLSFESMARAMLVKCSTEIPIPKTKFSLPIHQETLGYVPYSVSF